MPRDLPLGNGNLLVNFDGTYALRDLYYPHVGMENHVMGHHCRVGVWVDGDFSWIHGPPWTHDLRYRDETMETSVTVRNSTIGLSIVASDVVDFREPILLRRFTVFDDRRDGAAREVRLFLGHNLWLYGNEIGDTALYHPDARAIIHYKARRYFCIALYHEDGGLGPDQFAVGVKRHGAEGTWRDAEDGHLSGNRIAQGSVDSIIGLTFSLEPGASHPAQAWLAAGQTMDEVLSRHRRVNVGWAGMRKRTREYWRMWVHKEDTAFAGLSAPVITQYKRSLLLIRTQIDAAGGILAANDSDITSAFRDTYSYVWPRDGALISFGLDQAGYHELTLRFFRFCRDALTSDGYFMHKYNPDGSLASSWHPFHAQAEGRLPIQEDETALVLWALWNHFFLARDVEALGEFYVDLVRPAAEFLCTYLDASGLPKPSWDLWEERYGVHAFTVGAVYGGLRAASNMARFFGEMGSATKYAETAERVRAAAIERLYDPQTGRFLRSLLWSSDGTLRPDPTLDCSIFGLVRFGLLDPVDPRAVSTMEAVWERLRVRTAIGGTARYENDGYHQVSRDLENVPGNPWFICSLWEAQWHAMRARTEAELEPVARILEWVTAHALPSGVLAEQLHPFDGSPLSVSPLTWSHGEFVTAVLAYLDRYSTLSRCEVCDRPSYQREQNRIADLHAAALGVQPEEIGFLSGEL